MQTIDVNCDMGESTTLWPYALENDTALFPFISSINIACGFHAGDPHTMHELVDAALLAGISIGAHPGFADRDNFGRSTIQQPPMKLYDDIIYQMGALDAFLKINGTRLQHVKPHGALYNMAAKDEALAMLVANAVQDYDSSLILFGLAGSHLIKAGLHLNLKTVSEVFADRSYLPDGSLTPRNLPGAMIEDDRKAVSQVLQMIGEGTVTAIDGSVINVKADTLCLHSDGPHALTLAKNIHHAFQQQGIVIKPV